MGTAIIERLIAKAITRSNSGMKDYYSDYLQETLEVKRLPLNKVFQLMSGADKLELAEAFDLNLQLIYESCPILKDKELQEAYDVVEPTDIIVKLFDDNIGEINKLALFILAQYGLGEVKDQVKK